MIKSVLIALLFSVSSLLYCQRESIEINVLAVGAEANTNTNTEALSTKAFQKAIDSCYSMGGGRVLVPKGIFKIGTIVLKSNVELHLEKEAKVLASRSIEEYHIPLQDAVKPVLIYANGARNIKISGMGTIDGQAEHVYDPLRETDKFIADITENAKKAGVEMKRYYVTGVDVNLITLVNCERVEIVDVSIINSSFWSVHLLKCQDVLLENATIESSLEKGVNADGVDINCSRDVEISKCQIHTGDDAIVIKTWDTNTAENIHVHDCVVSSSSTALKVGTETKGDIRNVVFENCVVKNTNRGLSVVVRDGANVSNIEFSNIELNCTRRHFNWWGNADPIWVYLDQRGKKSGSGSIRDIRFYNVVANGMGTSKIESKINGGLSNIELKNVELRMIPENFPDKRATHALVIDNAQYVNIQETHVSWTEEESQSSWQSALTINESKSIVVDQFSNTRLQSEAATILINNSSEISFRNTFPMTVDERFIHINGDMSGQIQIEEMVPLGQVRLSSDVSKDALIVKKQ